MGLFLIYAKAMQEAIDENRKEYDDWMQNTSPMGARKPLEDKLLKSIMIKGRGRFDPKIVREFISMELTFG